MHEFPIVPLGEEKLHVIYCRHCDTNLADREVANKHLDTRHEIYYARPREDFITGEDLIAERMEMMRVHDLVVESLVGAEDFVTEFGD